MTKVHNGQLPTRESSAIAPLSALHSWLASPPDLPSLHADAHNDLSHQNSPEVVAEKKIRKAEGCGRGAGACCIAWPLCGKWRREATCCTAAARKPHSNPALRVPRSELEFQAMVKKTKTIYRPRDAENKSGVY